MCEANSMIRVHSGTRLEFNLKTLQVIPDVVPSDGNVWMEAAFGEQTNL